MIGDKKSVCRLECGNNDMILAVFNATYVVTEKAWKIQA